MKNKIKNLIGIIVIVMLVAVNVVYAENETNENTASNTTSNTTTETNTSKEDATENTSKNETNTTKNEIKSENKVTTNTTKSETKKKSSNANLKNLGIKPNDFKGFKPSKTTYDVEVPNSVEKIEVYAQVQDSKAEVTGTGNKKLAEGLNEFSVAVTAEDGTEKTYTINVTRLTKAESEEEKEQDENVEQSEYVEGSGLINISVENATLEPEFQTNTYEYNVKYIGEATQLNIKTETTDSNYIVEVTGNEDLQEGENIITILVSDKNGDNVATYQLKVEKKLVDEEAIAREKAERTKMLIIAGSIAVAVVVIIVIIIVIKRRKNNEVATEYTLPYSTMDNEEDYRALLEVDEPKKEETKEDARKAYLENYNNDDNYYEEEKPKKRKVKAKGKRYK